MKKAWLTRSVARFGVPIEGALYVPLGPQVLTCLYYTDPNFYEDGNPFIVWYVYENKLNI